MFCQRLSVGLKFSNTFVYVNLLPTLKSYNKALWELIEYLFAQALDDIIIVARAVCVFIIVVFLIIFAAFKPLENLVSALKLIR